MSRNFFKKIAITIAIIISILIVIVVQNSSNDISHNQIIKEVIKNPEISEDRKIEEIKLNMVSSVVKLTYISKIPAIMSLSEAKESPMGSATGFSIGYISDKNISYVITNDHFCTNALIDPTSKIVIEKTNKTSLDYTGEGAVADILYSSPEYDLCLVATKTHIPAVKLKEESARINPFDTVYVIGAPDGTLPIILKTFYSGEITRKKIKLGGMSEEGNSFLLISEEFYPGHSGSPVFNNEGEVIGIIFATLRTYGGIAIKVDDLRKFLNDFSKM